jgi:hypothetical protein
VHPTSGSLRGLGAFFWLRVFSTSQAFFSPAHLRVTQTVSHLTQMELIHMQEKIKTNPLYQKATETILSTIVTAILSVGLISGSTYLLFGYQNELETIERVNSEFEIVNVQYSSYDKMANVVKTAPLTDEQIYTEIDTINALKENKTKAKLDEEFVEFTINWCDNLLMELATAKGTISGFVFQKNSVYGFYETQLILLSKYDSDISAVQEIKSLVVEWESLDIPAKSSRISEIENLVTVQVEKLQAGMSRIQQSMASSQVKIDALNKFIVESDRAYNRLQIKLTVSIIGIIAGLLLLVVIIYAVFFDSKVKAHSKVDTQKDIKSKSKSNIKKRG